MDNITDYCKQLNALRDQHPGILNGEVLTHFLINGKRVLSYYVFQGVSEIVSTLDFLAEENGVNKEDISLTCEKVENPEARRGHKRKALMTVISLK